ncbi:MAG: ROK family protein [Verrucomicrobiales bacterium]|jgi:glucokinase|nr:ROK family protein [Verrucomicrobiales bacterium]|tara:strand:+ start:4621 stop:5634 length:1014 start_codon:yes stop_codon:yes gene_type:complete
MDESAHFAGLDIGGTTVKAALLNSTGRQIGQGVELRSHGSDGFKATFKQLHLALETICSDNSVDISTVAAVGIDVPAPSSNGVIWGQANLNEDWVGTNIRDEFSKEIHRPCYMTNDGNAAAYGEWILRPGHDGPLLFVAPGTGLGGGFVLGKGQLYEGCNGLAMELGAISVPFREEDGSLPECAGKGPGSLEAWVSLVALRRRLKLELAKEENQEHPLSKTDISIQEKAFQLRDFCEKEDPLARSIFKQQAHILGWAMGDQASELDPGLIVIGGGLAETSFRDWYLDHVRAGFEERAPAFYVNSPIPPHGVTTRFDWAVGGDYAAAIGVAHKAMELL